ncbi:hypothetical protein J4477_02900 [Candidatus Pacearchaeota archaeon]|nr:hypothetical protein [Candidatus Pacearchaeota archaeon]
MKVTINHDQAELKFTGSEVNTWLAYETDQRRNSSGPSSKSQSKINWEAIEKALEEDRRKKNPRGAIVNPETYREFVAQGIRYYDANPSEFYFQRSDLLVSFFPNRFGAGKKQDLEQRQYNDYEMYGLFRRMIDYAEKHTDD